MAKENKTEEKQKLILFFLDCSAVLVLFGFAESRLPIICPHHCQPVS